MSLEKITEKLSKSSLLLSSVCVIHCLSVPFVLVMLPVFADFFTETLERWLVLSILPLSIAGFVPTWLKHKNLSRLAQFVASLGIIVIAQFYFHSGHDIYQASFDFFASQDAIKALKKPFLTFLGALGLAWVTYKNNRHTHVCENKNHVHAD